MTDRRGSTATGGAAPADQPGGVRNVALVGHSGSGKTTLVEALLSATGAIQRMGRVEDGTTVSDFDEVEIRQQRSVNLTVAPLTHASQWLAATLKRGRSTARIGIEAEYVTLAMRSRIASAMRHTRCRLVPTTTLVEQFRIRKAAAIEHIRSVYKNWR